ncbi:MAG TPA: hypothetical protein VIH96_12885 [Paraburkholderia sp.]|jgi:hypothetical protein
MPAIVRIRESAGHFRLPEVEAFRDDGAQGKAVFHGLRVLAGNILMF